jgi:hypothetical protein
MLPIDPLRQWGASGGSATHKEPTHSPSADSTQNQASNMAATSPPDIPCGKPMHVRPIHFNLPKVDLLTISTANRTKQFEPCSGQATIPAFSFTFNLLTQHTHLLSLAIAVPAYFCALHTNASSSPPASLPHHLSPNTWLNRHSGLHLSSAFKPSTPLMKPVAFSLVARCSMQAVHCTPKQHNSP